MVISKDKAVSIVIPIYNESENIGVLVEKIISNMANFIYEIIIVNDASDDNPSKVLAKYIFYTNFKIIENANNCGQSKSIYNGIINSKYDTIVTIDGDGQNNPKDILLLAQEYFKDKEIYLVGGIRFKRKDM